MTTLKLEDYHWDALNCCGCKGCVWVDHIYTPGIRHGIKCPSIMYYFFDTYSALGRNKLATGLLDGSLEFTPKAVDIIYKCNLCGACDVGCKRNLDLEPLMVIETLRIKAVEKGSGPPYPLKAIAQKVLETGNRYGLRDQPPEARTPKRRPNSPCIYYFPGCNALFNQTNLTSITEDLLMASGLEFVRFPGSCCGRPLYVAGMADEARAIAKANISVLEEAGIQTIITGCAECYKTWKVDYPKLLDNSTSQMPYRILHLTQVLEPLISKGAIRLHDPIPLKAAYHDACNLGRLSEEWHPWRGRRGKWGLTYPPKIYRRGTYGEYDSPREILSSIKGLELVELPRSRENTLCCGAGGGVMDAFPEFAMTTALSRLKEAVEVGIEAIVTSCPFCLEHLSRVAKKASLSVKIYDISEMVAHCLGLHQLSQAQGGES